MVLGLFYGLIDYVNGVLYTIGYRMAWGIVDECASSRVSITMPLASARCWNTSYPLEQSPPSRVIVSTPSINQLT